MSTNSYRVKLLRSEIKTLIDLIHYQRATKRPSSSWRHQHLLAKLTLAYDRMRDDNIPPLTLNEIIGGLFAYKSKTGFE